MKKITILLVLVAFVVSCGSKKKVERALTSGNYNKAISKAVKQLQNNKDAKRKQDYILLLKDAYDKANDRDIEAITGLKTSKNPEFYRRIYETYNALANRQNAVKPLLPLSVNGREVFFKQKDYTNEIVKARENVSDFYYEKGIALLEGDDKFQIRNAYNTLAYIEDINPNYEKTRELMQEAHERGTAHVIVDIENQTRQIIPRRLEDALLDFDTYGLNQFWTQYHADENEDMNYDYAMQLQLARINISPEQVREREVVRQQRVKDGWQYRLDANGNVAKDSLGNDIKEDKIITVRARVFETEQFKQAEVLANVVFTDLKAQETIEQFNINSGFVFEHFYATFRGDRRALNNDDRNLIRNRPIPFPTNEQMIFDSGEDLKLKLKDIISDYKL
ncbi:hypothetical protein BTO05_04030 [Winogradskyella sp. PC-19]|uniref:hypothetical protein n=1 Tax=unclassified Winogradskyella TaxID=2615021 RepID=UPI000B57E5A0|nr:MULTISPECIES: hypothetical protein [unclassified Winogradskyella]ARV10712.1 hypothetical protein BTO05_04030 [Winogradskyella sp. PC-19]